jgi:hypothetical protein
MFEKLTELCGVYDADNKFKYHRLDLKLPKGIATFWLRFGEGKKRRQILVLDPYGIGDLAGYPDSIMDKVLPPYGEYTLGIDKDTGEIILVTLDGNDAYIGGLCRASPAGRYLVPKRFLKRLKELESAKLPFAVTVDPQVLCSYVDRWSSLQDIADGGLVVLLNFRDGLLWIYPDGCDLVTTTARE